MRRWSCVEALGKVESTLAVMDIRWNLVLCEWLQLQKFALHCTQGDDTVKD